jgi:lysophospholipase L1-like esterase
MPKDWDAWDDLVLAGFILLPLLLGRVLYALIGPRQVPQRVPVSRLLLGNMVLFLFLFSLGLLAGEIYYRFFYDTTQVHSVTKTSWRWFQRHWRVNKWGQRDDVEYTQAPAPGKRRVTFVGDSFTAGHGVEVHQRFANLYRARRPDLEVHVLADCGLDTGHQLFILKQLTSDGYQLDQVVLCYYLNDTGDLLPKLCQEFRKHTVQPSVLFRSSYFLNTLYWRWRVFQNPYTEQYYHSLIESYEGETWQLQQERLTHLRDLVRSNGGRLAVVTWPFLNYGPDYQARSVHEKLEAFWKDQGVPHLDLLKVLGPYPAREMIVNPLDPHPNARAHALAAEAIAEFLDPLVPTKK